jgi:hypothetical protein
MIDGNAKRSSRRSTIVIADGSGYGISAAMAPDVADAATSRRIAVAKVPSVSKMVVPLIGCRGAKGNGFAFFYGCLAFDINKGRSDV